MNKFERIIMDKTFIVKAEIELEPQVENLFAVLEQIDRNKLIHGFSLQIDWSVYYLHERDWEFYIDYARLH